MNRNKLIKYALIVIIFAFIYYFYNNKNEYPNENVSNIEQTTGELESNDFHERDEVKNREESTGSETDNRLKKRDKLKVEADIFEYWSGKWKGIDKWKRTIDVIRLEKQGGAFVLLEERNEPKIYDFDNDKNVFVWKTDYYGKELKHIIKFINHNTLLRNSWSGKKDFPISPLS